MRTIQTIGVPDSADSLDAEALVVALKSRTMPAEEAVKLSLQALKWLRGQGCQQFLFKYCSTFDSTDAGNIGPVADALMAALAESGNEFREADFTIACPALPENNRTVYRGHLFVGDALLNESGMESHPLTPMKDPNLVRVLQAQTKSRVNLLPIDKISQGVEAVRQAISAMRRDGVRFAITDALSNEDLRTLGAACANLPLITGGSGIAIGLPDNFRKAGLLEASDTAGVLPSLNGGAVVLAGSASRASNAQVTEWRKTNPAFRIDPLALARGEAVADQAVAFAQQHATGSTVTPVLIYATATPEEVRTVQHKLGVSGAGQLVESALANIARRLRNLGVRKFVVAGGETSGAVVQALGVKTLRIGEQIDPGVPVTASIGADPLALVLKSGNFGSIDFFAKALRKLEGNN
jgi:3-dehydrotetronate 4-kinase